VAVVVWLYVGQTADEFERAEDEADDHELQVCMDVFVVEELAATVDQVVDEVIFEVANAVVEAVVDAVVVVVGAAFVVVETACVVVVVVKLELEDGTALD